MHTDDPYSVTAHRDDPEMLLVLARGLDALFGPSAPVALIVLAGAVSGLTRTPFNVQIRKAGGAEPALIRLIQNWVSRKRAPNVTAFTTSGVGGLISFPTSRTLIFSSAPREAGGRLALERLLAARPVNDRCSNGAVESHIHTVRPRAIVLGGDVQIESPSALQRLLSPAFDSPGLHDWHVLTCPRSLSREDSARRNRIRTWERYIKRNVTRILWKRRVMLSEAQACQIQQVRTAQDRERIQQFEALISVLALMQGPAAGDVVSVPDWVPQFAFDLVRACHVADVRGPLTHEVLLLLLSCQGLACASSSEARNRLSSTLEKTPVASCSGSPRRA